MLKYCENNKIDVFKYVPIQFIFDFSSTCLLQEINKFCIFFNTIEKLK
jgi:hypothetical protein